ncbi:MAG TPA: hypothetical protein VGR73_18845 [Bryobacteraceae bacterium]|nr:hypothetical protein [Bryobacteraceae bacterium]
MSRNIQSFFLLLVVLAPSVIFAWRAADMPEFGSLHDDGIFYVSAKSLATGNGYRITSLPENAYQTKFPPLYPFYLSIIWRLNPSFPENLRLATLACWLCLVVCLVGALILYKSSGLTSPRCWIAMALLALSPYMAIFGTRIFSEIPFTALVLATLILARKEGDKAILAAGVAASAAYLTRTAGIALVASVLVWIVMRRDFRRAKLFAIVTVPVVIAWAAWTATNHTNQNLTLTYYTDYLGFQLANVGWDNLAVVLWKNFDQILYGMGALVMPKIFDNLPFKILTQVIAAAMIAGVVRLARRGVLVDYAIFSAFSVAILLVWHYPATERFVLPMFPLLAAGLVAEGEHLWTMLRPAFHHRDRGQRIAGFLFGATVAAVCLFALALQVYVTFFFMPETAEAKRIQLAARRADYEWMAANLPPSATVLSYDDPLLYLYTGRRGNYLPMMPRWWYAEDHRSMVNAYKDLETYCRDRGLSYVYFGEQDLFREAGDEERRAVQELLESNGSLAVVHSSGSGILYKVLPKAP